MAATKLAAVVTLLSFLGPVACQGSNSSPICLGGWLRPVKVLNFLLCPPGSSRKPPPGPSPAPSAPSLSVGYYNYACPNAEKIVRDVVENATCNDPGVGAGLIRLFFHDCFVQGCDASVLLKNTSGSSDETEMFGAPNVNSLRQSAFKVIDDAKAALEEACPNNVSCADIVAFAARDASNILSYGKISFAIPAGRYDGRVSLASEANQNLPGPSEDLQQLKASFASKVLDTNDLVTLSGAHTIGLARCMFISNRPGMNATLAIELSQKCSSGDSTRVNQDYKTPDVLDSQYYQNVNDNDVLFDSDAALSSAETQPLVNTFAKNLKEWEKEFADAMVKMGNIGVKTSANGEIRKTCSIYNS
ncbi:peroxidase 2-like [Phragmites australis]|uniref:peroxidase 2-like n=1 Tax=Phragmites australis TaxID=29695 RepID=UPI002D788B72|nr:peroxidase 2-like [Phragmites australis]